VGEGQSTAQLPGRCGRHCCGCKESEALLDNPETCPKHSLRPLSERSRLHSALHPQITWKAPPKPPSAAAIADAQRAAALAHTAMPLAGSKRQRPAAADAARGTAQAAAAAPLALLCGAGADGADATPASALPAAAPPAAAPPTSTPRLALPQHCWRCSKLLSTLAVCDPDDFSTGNVSCLDLKECIMPAARPAAR
jgi:hypothetical protein